MTCLGQINNTYLILLKDNTLLLMDQHAAHEKVLMHFFEQQAGAGQSQLLALTGTLPLGEDREKRLKKQLAELTRLGFLLNVQKEHGKDSLLQIRGLPPILDTGQGISLLEDILDNRTDGMEDVLHLMACRAAIKAGQRLTADEAAHLLAQWQETPDNLFCPHGRPTVLSFGPPELEKLFKRHI